MTATSATSAPPREASRCDGSDVRRSMSVETVRFDAEHALVQVTGELDIATSAPLWAVLDCHRAAGRRHVRLDMSRVSFLDATALRGIVAARRMLLADRGTLDVVGARTLVARLFRLTGLDAVLLVGGPLAGSDAQPGAASPIDDTSSRTL